MAAPSHFGQAWRSIAELQGDVRPAGASTEPGRNAGGSYAAGSLMATQGQGLLQKSELGESEWLALGVVKSGQAWQSHCACSAQRPGGEGAITGWPRAPLSSVTDPEKQLAGCQCGEGQEGGASGQQSQA